MSAPKFMVKLRREQTWWASVYECIAEQFPDEPIVVNKANPMQPASTKMQEARAFHRASGGQSSSVLLGAAEPRDETQPFAPVSDGVFEQAGLPFKRLPPGKKSDYWSLFVHEGRGKVSYRTFLRVWSRCFEQLLGFQDFSQHSCCNTCAELKDEIRYAATYAQKASAVAKRASHLQQQWRDRLIYWKLRGASQRVQPSWLCIIIDGADQAKFRVMRAAVWPKSLSGEYRPKVKVVGAMAHGNSMNFSFVEEDVSKGSNLTIEILARTIDNVLQRCRERRLPMPAHLWVQVRSGSTCKQHAPHDIACICAQS